jgi:hypothetical protein
VLGSDDYRIKSVIYSFKRTHAHVVFTFLPTGEDVEMDYIGHVAVVMIMQQRMLEEIAS